MCQESCIGRWEIRSLSLSRGENVSAFLRFDMDGGKNFRSNLLLELKQVNLMMDLLPRYHIVGF